MSNEIPDHVRRNRQAWDVLAAEFVEAGRRGWAEDRLTWGDEAWAHWDAWAQVVLTQ